MSSSSGKYVASLLEGGCRRAFAEFVCEIHKGARLGLQPWLRDDNFGYNIQCNTEDVQKKCARYLRRDWMTQSGAVLRGLVQQAMRPRHQGAINDQAIAYDELGCLIQEDVRGRVRLYVDSLEKALNAQLIRPKTPRGERFLVDLIVGSDGKRGWTLFQERYGTALLRPASQGSVNIERRIKKRKARGNTFRKHDIPEVCNVFWLWNKRRGFQPLNEFDPQHEVPLSYWVDKKGYECFKSVSAAQDLGTLEDSALPSSTAPEAADRDTPAKASLLTRGHGAKETPGYLDRAIDTQPSPLEWAQSVRNGHLLLQAIDELSDGYRRIMLLKWFSTLDHAEVAERLRLSSQQLSERSSRALRKMEQILKEGGYYLEDFV